jgi:hypothetical protein
VLRYFVLLIFPMLLASCNQLGKELPGQDIAVRMASSWGQKLNNLGTVPENGFRGFYFDRRSPTQLIHWEDGDAPAIKYSWSDFHNIDSPNFGAYWVGRLHFDAPATQQISVSQSRAKSRIFIDGKIVFDSSESINFTHTFSAGEHVIEVEYANNWHTTEYKVTFQDVTSTRRMNVEELTAMMQMQQSPAKSVSYVGIYESGAAGTKLNVNVPATDQPIILWLSSYEAIDWQIATKTNIDAVIVASYMPGSRVHGISSGKTIYLDLDVALPFIYGLDRRCSCTAGTYYCEQKSDIMDVGTNLKDITGLPLGGYAVAYSPSDLAITPWNKVSLNSTEERRSVETEAKRQCLSAGNPDFDELMSQN